MAGNTEMIDQLVSESALKSLDTLNTKLASSYTEMEKLLAKVQLLSTELSQPAKSYIELANSIEKVEKVVKAKQKVEQEELKTLQDIKKLTDEVINSEKEQIKTVENQEKVTKKLDQTTKQLLSTVERTAKGIDISAYIQKNENGMKNYSNAINAAYQQIGIIQGLQADLNDSFREGAISEDEYNNALGRLVQKQTEYEQSLTSLHQNYEQVGEAQRAVFNPTGEAFDSLDPKIKKQTLSLVDMNVELNAIRTQQKELDKLYKDGEISLDVYTQRKAELNTIEDIQAKAVSNASKELELNIKTVTTAIGSYENLSAQYSLMKIQINALGEEEGKNASEKRKLEIQAKALYDRMNELQKATGRAQLQVGDYTLINKELEGSLNKLNPALGRFITGARDTGKAVISFIATPIGAVILATTALVGVIKTFISVQDSNISTGRSFKATMDGLNNTLDYAKTAFATIDFTNFIAGLREANRLGREASLMLQELFEMTNSFNLTSKKELAEIEELKTQLRDVNLSSGERIAIADQIIEKTKKVREEEKKVIDQEVEGYNLLLKSQTNLTDAEKDYIIVNYNRNKANINNVQTLIELEKELVDISLRSPSKYKDERYDAVNEQIKNLKTVTDASIKADAEMTGSAFNSIDKVMNAWKNYSKGGEDLIGNYVKSEEKLIDVDIRLNRELRMTERLRSQILKSEEKAAKRDSSKGVKEYNKELKATAELETFNFKKKADLNEKLYKDELLSFDDRRNALRDYIDFEIGVIQAKESEEIKQKELTESQKQLIQEKALYEIFKLEQKYIEENKNLNVKEAENQVKNIQAVVSQRSEDLNKAMQDELVVAAKNYEQQITLNVNNEQKRVKITEEYQKLRLEIIRKYNQEAFDFEVEQLKISLDNSELGEDQKLAIQKKIDVLRKKNAKEMAEFEIQQTEDKVDKMLTIEEQFNKAMSDARVKSLQTIWSMALDLASMYYDQQLSRIDELEKREQDYYDEKLKLINENVEAGLLSEEEADARRRIIEETQLEREKKYDEQRKEIQRKQAIWEKANSIVKATMNTAVGVTSAFPNLVLMGIIAAIGAAQIAMIASQQIPAYAEGTDNHPGGWAMVGDGGRSEMVILPSGEMWKTPDTDTFVNLPRGTEVLPDYRKAMMEMNALPSISYEDGAKTILMHDDVLRKNTKETNRQLNSISKGISSINANNMYKNQKNGSGYKVKTKEFI